MFKIERLTTDKFNFDLAKVKTDYPSIELVCLQDSHVGSPNCRIKTFLRLIRYIQDRPHCLWFGNGDLFDNAIANSVASPYESEDTPNGQMKHLVKIFEPIAEKCIGIVSGNHEGRSKKTADFDLTEDLADHLGIEYYGSEMITTISNRGKTGGTAYALYNCHSGSGHKNAGLTLNAMQRDWNWLEGVDIYCKGHDHQVGVIPIGAEVIDFPNNRVMHKNRWLWCPGSFLSRAKSYAAKKPYSTNPDIYYSLRLDMRKGKKRVDTITHYLED